MPHLPSRAIRAPLAFLIPLLIGTLWISLIAQRPSQVPEADHATLAAAPGPAFALELPPERLANGGWRLHWSSIPGRRYVLQRWTSDNLGAPGNPPWSDLAMVQATGTRSSADDPSAILADRRFYRVVLLADDGGDLIAPAISAIQPRYTASNNQPAARLSVSASDNVGVTRVEFFNGTIPLGTGLRGGDGTWSLTLLLDTRRLGARFLVARAYDAAGNFANSPVFPLGLVDPDHFVPLGPDGLPIEGGVVPAVSIGAWGPVEFRPGGRDLFGRGAGFFLRFPAGVRLLQIDNRSVLEFTNVTAGFSAGYPIQLRTPLERTTGGPRRLAVGGVELADVLALFDLTPVQGVTVQVFNRFELRWRAGRIDNGILSGARFSLPDIGIPLPELSGDYPELQVDFSRAGGLRLPFHGEFPLPDGSAHPARVLAGRGNPLWLTLHPDGRLTLTGSAGIELGNGGSFRADVRMDDPFYQISIAADRLRLQSLTRLVDLLPARPADCLPATTPGTDTELSQTTDCLQIPADAFQQFAAALVATGASAAIANADTGVPAEPLSHVASALEAWAHAALASGSAPLPFDAVRDLVRQSGESAAASHDLEAAATFRLALHRMAVAAASGRFSGGAETRAAIDAALAESDAAVLRRLDEPDATASAGGLRSALRLLVRTDPLRQQLGRPPATAIASALTRALSRFAIDEAGSLAVTRSGEFSPVSNPTITALPRAAAAEHLRTLVALIADAKVLGFDPGPTLLDETLAQLASRLLAATNADLADAESTGDYPRFLLALLDLVELVEHRRSGVFPEVPALSALPVAADLPAVVSRLGQLLAAELDQPLGDRSLHNQAAELRALVRIFRATPGTLSLATPAARRPFDQLELRLAEALASPALTGETRVSALADILEAGTLHAEYGRRLGLTPAVDWESVRLPRIATVLAARAAEAGAWSELDRATRVLIDTARLPSLAARPGARRANLEEAARLVTANRAAARAALRDAGSAPDLVDLALPGGIAVDQAAGSIRYNRLDGGFQGSFRGTLQLPKFGTRLVIHRARLGSGGLLDLEASGDLRVPEGTPFLSATIPPTQPVRLRWSATDGLRLSGAANVTLANGMFFRGSLGLEDPIYRFHLEAGGLQVNLARALATASPAFPPDSALNRPDGFDEAGLELWSDYLGNLGSTLGALGLGPIQPVPNPAPGTRPELVDPVPPVDPGRTGFQAWARLSAIEERFGGGTNALATLPAAADMFVTLTEGMVSGPDHIDVTLDPVAARRSLAGSAPASTPTLIPTLDRALQIDLGNPEDTAVAPGPAQDIGRFIVGTTAADIALPNIPGAWNVIGPDGISSVRFADGAPAPGVTIQVGVGLTSDSLLPLASIPPAPVALSINRLRHGPYTQPILNDSLSGASGPSGNSSVGVRIRGLPPGLYIVFAAVSGDADGAHRFQVRAGGTATPPTSWPITRIEVPRDFENVRNWQEGVNFTRTAVALTEPGEELIVTSLPVGFLNIGEEFEFSSGEFGSVDPFVTVAGELAAVQVIPARPSIASFSVFPTRVNLGEGVDLAWSVRNAEQVVVTGSDGFRFEAPPLREADTLRVEPTGAVTYTLSAGNRNGGIVTSNLFIQALGSATLTKAAASAANARADIARDARRLADEAAKCALEGRTNCPDVAARTCELLGPFLDDLRSRLLDCAIITGQPGDTGFLIEAVEAALEIAIESAADSQLAACPETGSGFSIDDVTTFATCVLTEFYRRTGSIVTATTQPDGSITFSASVIPAVVDAFQVQESTRIIRQLVAIHAQLDTAGSPLGLVLEHLDAHAGNIARRIIVGTPPAGAADDPRLGGRESELSGFLDGLLVLDSLSTLLEEPPAVPDDVARLVVSDLLHAITNSLAKVGFLTSVQGAFDRGSWLPILETVDRAATLNAGLRNPALSNLVQSIALRAADGLRDGTELSSEFRVDEFLLGRGSAELRPRDVRAFRLLERFLPNPAFTGHLAHRLEFALDYIANRVPDGGTFSRDDLHRRSAFIGQLADLQFLLEGATRRGATLDLPTSRQPLNLGSNLLARARDTAIALDASAELIPYSQAVFEARRNLKLSQSTLLPPEASQPAGASASASASASTPALQGAPNPAPAPDPATELFGASLVRLSLPLVRDAATRVAADARRFTTNPPDGLPGDFTLPASLQVNRVFGEVHFNRLTGFLRGGFGGDLEFPDAGVSAAIRRASIASDGSFTLDAATAGPLPFGQLRLESDLRVDFAPARGTTVAGAGRLFIPTATSTQIVAVAVNYDESAKRLGFEVSDRNLNLALSDDFALFDLGGGLTTSTDTPEGTVRLTGSVGLFARSRPLPASLSRSNFLLSVENAVVALTSRPDALIVSLEGGTLRLPEHFSTGDCPTNLPGVTPGPSIALNPARPILLTIPAPGRGTPSFQGELAFSRLGLRVPGLTNVSAEICSATLVFPSNALPRLTRVNAAVGLSLPGRTNQIDLVDASWGIDGFPTGTLALRDPLPLFQQGGFDFTLLGTASASATPTCPAGTALTIARTPAGTPFFRLDGAVEFGFPPDVLGSTNGGRLFARTCGFVSGGPDRAPELALDTVALGGSFRLGGRDGLLIENGELALQGLTNLFQPSPTRPFTVRLAGQASIPSGPRLGLQNARLEFIGEPLPRFSLGGLSIAQNPSIEVTPGLAFNVTAASLQFFNPTLPLPGLFHPTNIVVGISASASIPPGPDPLVSGIVQGLTASLRNGQLTVGLNGIGISFADFEIPPLTLTGEVFLGGLDAPAATPGNSASSSSTAALAGPGPNLQARPDGPYFAGRVGGTLDGIGVKALLAFDLQGPIGVCLDVSAGPAGIPLGPTGFLLTGVQGGVSFLNTNGDPCDFATFIPLDPAGRPLSTTPSSSLQAQAGSPTPTRPPAAMSWDQYRSSLARQKLAAEVERRSLAARASVSPGRTAFLAGPEAGPDDAPAFPCPTGDCPPASVNILCQPHPDTDLFPNAVIMKFSALDARALDRFGITRAFVESLGATPADIAHGVAAQVRAGITPLIPRADPALLGTQLAADLNRAIEEQLADLEATLDALVRQALGGNAGGSIYDRVLDTAARGVPCPDATVKLTGTFSHAAVSTTVSGTVGVVYSSAGSAGIVGALNLTGVPVGSIRSFVNLTDAQGLPNPSYCGDALLAIGPIEFGQLQTRFECPGCVTGFLGAFADLTGCLGETQTRAVLDRVAPRLSGRPLQTALIALTDNEKLAFAAHLFSQPPAPGLAGCWNDAARDALESFAPSLVFCGATQPKIFGIPLGESLVDVRAAVSRSGIAASFSFSPSFIINNLALCSATLGAACQPIFPALDSATLGFGLGFPDPVAASLDALEGKLSSPAAAAEFFREGFDHLLANSTITLGYQLNPFGIKLADGEGRAILPNLTAHPSRPGATPFTTPEERGLPSRLELLLAALHADLLANPLWKGNAEDIHLAFPAGSPQRTALQGRNLSFATDYFPHGGFLGAGRIALPKLLVDAPPPALGVIFDGSKDPLTRLGAAGDVVANHLLQTSDVGTLAFYVPAPNPPLFADAQGQPLNPQRLLEAIGRFDISVPNLANPYPFEVGFLRGELDGRLLGIPIARATVAAQPATATSPAFFRIEGGVPADSWFRSFVDSASLNFEIRQAPPLPIDVFFSGIQSNLQSLATQPAPSADAILGAVRQVENGLADALPKVSMELQVSNFRIPDALTNLLTTANASAGVFAYSPRFAPNTPATTPLTRARRDGGLAFKGSFRLANLVTITDAELAVIPKLNPAELPALSGLLRAPRIPLPGLAVHDVEIDFNTEPGIGEPFFHATGGIDPFAFDNPLTGEPLLSLTPLQAGSTRIGASVDVIRSGPGSVAVSLSVDPARLDMPILGPDLTVTIHGATASDPFTFSTVDPWTASVSISGALSIRDPFNTEMLRIGAGGQKFSASIAGDGLAFRELTVQIPGNLQVTVFPSANVPEGIPRTYTLGSGPASLRISSDGTFALDASLGGALSLPGLPAPALDAGASISITGSRLSITGQFRGGLLAPGAAANGTFTLNPLGQISLSGQATLPPQSFGALQLQGVSTPELSVALLHDGYALPSGARLRIVGVASSLLALSPFTNRANADFTARVTSGDFSVPNAFRVTGGRMELRRRSGTVTFDIDSAPELVLLPGTEAENRLSAPFTTLSVSTDGRFYADSGTRDLRLPGEVVLSGRLEIGNEPGTGTGTGTPALATSPLSLNFGTLNFGSVTSRTVRLTNTGTVPLVVGLTSTSASFIPTLGDIALAVGRSIDVPVEFRPATSGALSGQLQVLLSPGGSRPALPLSGTAVAVPVYGQNPSAIAFGDTPIGKPRTRPLTIRNLGLAPLVLSNATLTGPFSITPAINRQTIPPGGNLPLQLTFNPASLGSASGVLTLNANTTPPSHSTPLSGLGFTERWILVHEGGSTLRAAAFRDASLGWAAGDNDTLLQTTDAGHSWQRISPGFGGDFRAMAAADNLVALVGADGTVGLSTNAGAAWSRLSDPVASAPTNHWNAVAIRPGNPLAGTLPTLVLAGTRSDGGGILARQTSTGFVVAALPPNPLHALAQHRQLVTQPGRFIAVGDGGSVLRSTDGATTWTSTTVLPALPLRGVALSTLLVTDSDPRVLMVGDGGVYLRSTSFTGTPARTIFTTRDFQAAIPGLAVGQDGLVTGVPTLSPPNFTSLDPDGSYDLHGVASSPAGTFVVGQLGQIWLLPPSPPTGPFLTFSPAQLDFAIQPLSRSRPIELVLRNRGVTPLSLSRLAISGSTAFSVTPTAIASIPTNGTASVIVRFNPTTLGRQSAFLELTANDAVGLYRIPLAGHSQASEWPTIATPTTAPLVDLQLVSDTLAFAATGSSVLRSTNSGTHWTTAVHAPGVVRRIHFATATLGFATGGDASTFSTFPPCSGDCQSFILRTANAGTSWTSRPTGVGTRVVDIEFGSTTTGYAVTRSESVLGRTTAGDALKTTDGGLTWTTLPRPVPVSGSFDGNAVEAVTATTVFVASGGELFRSINGGSTWSRILATGANRINDIHFPTASFGVLVGDAGLIRRTTAGGSSSALWSAPAAFTTANLARVHFSDATFGWITASDTATATGLLFSSRNGGVAWNDEIRKDLAAGQRGPAAVTALNTTRILATDGTSIVRSAPVPAVFRGSPLLPEVTDFGIVALGTPVTRTIQFRNLGSSALSVSSLFLAGEVGTDSFDLVSPSAPLSIPAVGSVTVSVRFRADTLGRHASRLVAVTDGHEGTVSVLVVAEARVFPTPILLTTTPPGLTLRVDGNRSVIGPTTLTVVGPSTVPNDVINPFEWPLGTVHQLEAPSSQVLGGFEYAFQGWEPARPEARFQLTATNIPATYHAVYLPVRPVPQKASSPALAGEPRLAGPPTDTGVGPYIRISGAQLNLPGLGSPAVSGAAFLASDRFEFTLANAPLGNPSLLAVNAGSWRVSYTNAPLRFVVKAASPGLTILDKPASPPGSVLFDITRTAITAQIDTLAPTPIVPGIAELGPSRLAFSSVAQGSTRFSTFTTTASLRALALPGGGHAVTNTLSFRASDGPFTNRLTQFPTVLFNTPLVSLRRGTAPVIELHRNAAGAWGLLVTNFNLSLLGGPATPVAGSINGSRLTLNTGTTLGLGALVYNAAANGSLEWDLAGPSFRAVIPPGTLTVPGIPTGIPLNEGLVLDTGGNFDFRRTLPALAFDGIGINSGGPISHNFVRLHRLNGVTAFQLRDRRSFFGNTFQLALDVSSAGTASGTFSGELVLRDFLGCDEIGLGDVTLRYTTAGPFQFSGRVRGTLCSDLGADFRVEFGSGGARVCHLICAEGCSETVCLGTP